MRRAPILLLGVAMLALAACGPRGVVSEMTHKSERLGQCFDTTVARVETRLEDGDVPVPDSGSAVVFADGHYNVDYDQVPAMDASEPGDPAHLCVIDLPSQCPKGDTRGIRYQVKNLRTGQGWEAPDSEHMCGGA